MSYLDTYLNFDIAPTTLHYTLTSVVERRTFDHITEAKTTVKPSSTWIFVQCSLRSVNTASNQLPITGYAICYPKRYIGNEASRKLGNTLRVCLNTNPLKNTT